VFTDSDPVEGKPSVEIVQPDEYGVKSTLLATTPTPATKATISRNELEALLSQALSKFKPWTLDHRQHLAQGVRNGIRWKTAVPVEDKQADAATKRLWGG
jgi:hypothetical protein